MVAESVLRSIFEFVISAMTGLQDLAWVSREWRECVQNVVGFRSLRALQIQSAEEASSASRRGLLVLRRELALRRAHLRELKIWVGASSQGATASAWCSMLVHAPRLETLAIDSSSNDPSAPLQCIPIVAAAAQHCLRLNTLCILSLWARPNFARYQEERSAVETELAAVIDKLPTWTRFGGLRNLAMSAPFVDLTDPHTKATEFISTIATSCPLLETVSLQGKTSELHDNCIDESEQMHIGLRTWEQFCASCTELIEFEWTVVPFATSYFEVFGRYPKPKLDVLKLTHNIFWNWERYHRHYPPLAADGYEATARNPRAVLTACPALRRLIVYFDRSLSRVFGDNFVAAIAQNCRDLEKLEIYTVDQDHFVMVNFTDQALPSLAALPRLAFVEVDVPNITGQGLCAFLAFARSNEQRRRVYAFSLGDLNEPPCVAVFYDVVVDFLAALVEYDLGDDVQLQSSFSTFGRLVLRVTNGLEGETVHDLRWRQSYLATLLNLVDAVMLKYPDARLRVHLAHECLNGSRSVFYYGGGTDPNLVRQWRQWPPRFHSFDELLICTADTEIPSRWESGRPPATDIDQTPANMSAGDDDSDGSDRSDGSDGDDYRYGCSHCGRGAPQGQRAVVLPPRQKSERHGRTRAKRRRQN